MGGVIGFICVVIVIILILNFRRNKTSLPDINKPKENNFFLKEDIVILEQIGKGSFGEVYKGKLGAFPVAVK